MIIGISGQSVESHKKFAEKYHLNFTILSDTSTKTIEAYGALREKSIFGRKFMGVNRDTFIINPDGEIVREYRGVDPKEHAKQIIDDLKLLQSQSV